MNSVNESKRGTKAGSSALVFIFITVVVDVLALLIIIPVLPKLVEGFMGGDKRQAAEIFGVFGAVWALMQFIFSPALGALSDRFGRRPVILISCFGLGLDYVLMALAPSLWWLFAGRVISGITAANYPTARAYIADLTPPEKRAESFGVIGAAWGLGFVLGPGLGGLLGTISPRLPFWVAAGLTILNSLYGLFVLPESLAPEKRKAFTLRRANPVGSLALLRSHPRLLGLSSVYFTYFLAWQVLASVFVFYTNFRYGWGVGATGLTLTIIGVFIIIVQAGMIKRIIARFGERRSLLAGLICGGVGYAIYGLAPAGIIFLSGLPIFAFMGLFEPAALSLMTRHVAHSEQGELQGANSSIMGIAGMIGPWLFTQTFSGFIGPHLNWGLPGAPFLLASLLMAIALIAAWLVTDSPSETKKQEVDVKIEVFES